MAIKLVTVSMQRFGQLNQNRFYAEFGENSLSELECANIVLVDWVNKVKELMLSNVRFFNINVRGVGGQNNLSTNLPISITGNHTPEDFTTPFSSWVIQLETGLAGKQFRGRIYVPGHRAGDFQNGVLSANGITLSTAVMSTLNPLWCNIPQNTTGHHLVIHGEQEAHDTPVINMAIRPTMGCQRRRNIGIGA